MKAAKEDVELDNLLTTRTPAATGATDFLKQAAQLHANGYYGPSAIVAGSVLEDTLKKLCQRSLIMIAQEEESNLDLMNRRLTQESIYNIQAKEKIDLIISVRHKGVQGKWADISKEEVELMLNQLQSLLKLL